MDGFQVLLLSISEELGPNDVHALKFLCCDIFQCANKDMQDAKSIFLKLQKQEILSVDDTFIIKELLWSINQYNLLRQRLNVQKETVEEEMQIPGRARISCFRRFLFNLAEEVTDEELTQIKHLLYNKIPKSKMENITSMLDIFIEMEKNGMLSENTLVDLKKIFEAVNKSLLRMIENYETGLKKKCNSQEIQLKLYKMSSRPRGICLIINNFNFATARERIPNLEMMKDRTGSEVDKASLYQVFTRLHFEIDEKDNLFAEQITQTIDSYSKQDHAQRDCFICCILSHGDKGVIYGCNGQTVSISDLTSCFTKTRCPSLTEKPKIFFIQACQGHNAHVSVEMEADACSGLSRLPDDKLIPDEPDFLLGMATTIHHVSYRSPTLGSWYIQSLCEHLQKLCLRDEDLLSILTYVNKDVSNKNPSLKQMPQPCSSLRKKLFFHDN
ncbi:caspase-8-like [Bombina bombina]|uniref:caspase-8-like n=1 Tax=Bombina bombina TaxID=8345 RepID=UPI00235A4768|nr:caspase-8-like [Bombina bombina]